MTSSQRPMRAAVTDALPTWYESQFKFNYVELEDGIQFRLEENSFRQPKRRNYISLHEIEFCPYENQTL